MKKSLVSLGTAGAALLLLTGCVQSLDQSSSKSAPAAAETTTAAAATTAQFASVVAENSPSWQAFETDRVKCNLAIGNGSYEATDTATATACAYQMKTLTITASNTLAAFDRLGEPPAEISELVTRTRTALTPVSKLDADTCYKAPTTVACGESRTTFTLPTLGLSGVVDAWKPYTKG
ncbi:hypothetical protein [Arthrobacter woluwensis]|uniref:hypothetical protein n=1 Tax=Arthrobacter woluwensis TaxID=156980 RepID=UPI001AAE834D|nr:hypothetical protein [Arthrobacter woluwensis]QTF70624.1 hypothetical protein G8758_00300 [Arthrobacter woluwensis]